MAFIGWVKGWLKWLAWLLLDAFCIFAGFLPSLILNADPRPYIQGVNCYDRSYRFPYKDSTLETPIWVAINCLPSVLFGLGEVACNWAHFSKSFYKVATTFVFGALCNNSLAYLAKYYVGELRPDFVAVCNLECKKGVPWIPEPVCDPHSDEDTSGARLSFYSYHASHCMYYMVFTAFYMQARMAGGTAWTRMVRPTIQLNLVLIALWVGYTRVFDHKNHLSDVLIGLVQGALLAYLMVNHVFPDVFTMPSDSSGSTEGDDESERPLDLRSIGP